LTKKKATFFQIAFTNTIYFSVLCLPGFWSHAKVKISLTLLKMEKNGGVVAHFALVIRTKSLVFHPQWRVIMQAFAMS